MSTKKYRPSNGSEGCWFTGEFCDRCQKDADYRNNDGDSCQILCNTMVYDLTDPEYPDEWIYDEDGNPVCTAFEEEDKTDE